MKEESVKNTISSEPLYEVENPHQADLLLYP